MKMAEEFEKNGAGKMMSFKYDRSSETGIEGVLIIEPKVFGDARGYFFESFSQRDFDEK